MFNMTTTITITIAIEITFEIIQVDTVGNRSWMRTLSIRLHSYSDNDI